MKKIKIQNTILKMALDCVQGCTAKDNSRPVLKKIKIDVDEQNITFVSLDGYKSAYITLPHKNEDVDQFSFLIDYFKVPKSVSVNDLNEVFEELKGAN